MYAEIQAAIASARLLGDIATASRDLRNFNELAAVSAELNAKLLSATTAALAGKEKEAALSERVRALEQELAAVKNWDAQSKDYTLQAVGVEKLHFAQVYKPVGEPTKVRHWACAKCFQESKIYVLSATQDEIFYKCPSCGTAISPIVRGGALAPVDSAY